MEARNDKRPPPPEWINEKFIESAIQKREGTQLTVVSVDVKYATDEGSNLLSMIFRANTSIRDGVDEEKKKSLIVKCSFPQGEMLEFAKDMQAFSKESLMLGQVVPEVHAILQSAEGSSAFRPLAAHCYHTGQQPVDFLVLDDLATEGFRLAKGAEPLDWQHCAVVLRTYARLHAASALLLKRQPHYRDSLASNIFTGQHAQKTLRRMGSAFLDVVADELEKCPGYEIYSSKYRRYLERFDDLEYEGIKRNRNESKLAVITHGDCWKNNFLFKYDNGEVSEIRLCDFQLSTVTSPAADLQYFLFGNPNVDVHQHHLDSLLDEYHRTLTDLLKVLGLEKEAKAYSFQQLQHDMGRCSLIAVLFSGLSSVAVTSQEIGLEIAKAITDPENGRAIIVKTLRNPYSLPYMKYISRIFDMKGIL